MLAVTPHPEDIKAELRKRYRSVTKFEETRGLPAKSVADVLRGRAVQRTAHAIAKELGVSVHVLFPGRYKVSHISDDSTVDSAAQHLNAGGK